MTLAASSWSVGGLGVEIQCDGNDRLAEAFLNDLGMHSLGRSDGRCGVAQTIAGDAGQTPPFDAAIELPWGPFGM